MDARNRTRHAIRTVLALGLLALTTLASAPAQAQDPATTGPHAVSIGTYTQGDTAFTPTGFPAPVEITGAVFYPTDLVNGPYPFVLYLHGRHAVCTISFTWPCPGGEQPILSYRGYDYSAQQLASHGYIVVSISANGINARDNGTADLGALARAELIHQHLLIWQGYNTTGGAPFGSLFVGRIDLTRIGTMGHSRGGEGVLRHYLYNAGLPSPFPVKAIVPIAPTDFSRWQVNTGVQVATLLPYCDGDVSDLQGVHVFDDGRYQLGASGSQSYLTVMGANHNFFNSVWTPGGGPGAIDDWGYTSDPFCGTGGGNGRLSAAQQRDVGLAYLATYFRTFVGGESQFFGYVDGSAGRPPSVASLNLHTSYQGHDGLRRDVNRLLTSADLVTNTLGGAVTQTGLSPHDLCGGNSPQPQHCLSGQSTSRQPHTTPSYLSSLRGLSQLRTGWSSAGSIFTNDIPVGQRDVSSFAWLQFRASVNFTDTRNVSGQAQDLSVVFFDDWGGSQSLRVGQYSGALFYPPGTSGPVPKVLQNTVRIPLSALTLDKTRINRVRMAFDQRASGALLISDLHFYRGAATPDFGLSVSPGSATVIQGTSVTTGATVTSLNGFNSAVTLSASGLPSGVTASFTPNPVTPPSGGTASSTLTLSASTSATPGTYTVTVTGTSGTLVHSVLFSLTVAPGNFATYDPVLQAPHCYVVSNHCDSGTALILGRDTIVGGPEPNQPNTLNNSCADGTFGGFHSDESNDRIRVYTLDGTNFATGKTVRVEATVWPWAGSPASDALDLYYTANANAASPVWTYIATLVPTVGGVQQVLSATYTLPAGALQAVRANFRYGGAASPCTTGVYDDRDDLVFAVSAPDLTATYDSVLRTPQCATVGRSCDSGPSLLLGRDTLVGGAEPNQPNTVNSSCADGTSGSFHADESNDRIKVATVDGSAFAAGKTVKIEATVWAWSGSPTSDALDLYYAASAAAPVWTYITTLVPTVGGVQQVLSATYTLPSGALQAVRARFRYMGSAAACGTATFDDHDDLVFAVQ